jgi:hypothetical protein
MVLECGPGHPIDPSATPSYRAPASVTAQFGRRCNGRLRQDLRVGVECRHTLTRHPFVQVRYQPHRDQTATKVLIHRTLITPGDTQFACQTRRYRQAHNEESVLQ